MLFAGIDTAVRSCNLLTRVDNDARQRALRMAPQVLQRAAGAAGLVQFANPALEHFEYLGGREDGQDSLTMEEIQQLAAFGGIDPTIGPSNQGHCGNDRIQQLGRAIVLVLGHHLGRLRLKAVARVTLLHR